jgi:hypothetical protein
MFPDEAGLVNGLCSGNPNWAGRISGILREPGIQ